MLSMKLEYLSREIEYLKTFNLFHFVNYSYKKRRKNFWYFKTLLLFSQLILLILGFFVVVVAVVISRTSRICSCELLILYAIIVVFLTRIFRNLDFGQEWLLRSRAIELESLRSIVRRLRRVVVVRATYVLFSLETQSPKGHYIRRLSNQSVQWMGTFYWK